MYAFCSSCNLGQGTLSSLPIPSENTLKTYVCDEQVCRAETNDTMLIPIPIHIRCFPECGWGKCNGLTAQYDILNCRLGPQNIRDMPWIPSPILVPIEPSQFTYGGTTYYGNQRDTTSLQHCRLTGHKRQSLKLSVAWLLTRSLVNT